jgi:hypothetical protein
MKPWLLKQIRHLRTLPLKIRYNSHYVKALSKRISALCLLLSIFVSCQLNQPINVGDLSEKSGDIPTVVLRFNESTSDMKPEDATLTQVVNLDELTGTGVDLLFKSELSDINISSPTNFNIEITNAQPSGLNFQKIKDRYVPADYHTFLFTTIYHHFEKSRSEYLRLFNLENVDCTSCFRRMDVHVDPLDKTGRFSLVDNAAYITGLDIFVIFPQQNFLLVNVGMNEPIINHEVFHSIFEPLVDSYYIGTEFILEPDFITTDLISQYFQHGMPAPVGKYETFPLGNGVRINVTFSLGGFTAASYTVVNILNEGLADYFAFVFTKNSDILFHSFGDIIANGQNLREQRRLDRDHSFPPENYVLDFASSGNVSCSSSSGLNTCTTLRVKYQYLIGTILARSIVQVGELVGDHDQVARVIVRYLADFNNIFPTAASIDLPAVLGQLIVASDASGLKSQFCEVLLERFGADSSEINAIANCN